eukprot:CAMPEP_0202890320 /NCGR_PEP_ID=MMETSP1392-20130828/772_1 /ASSEMBLY_ACC=CAM_ASM_000868 /TAXON_ID=225041 /ORGANISM="Chlamydomonas chlamydogama, Strain SAG 11-48b" /LENGTH=158 /DNA_ID=CAMNT_0049573869 /DNA_START=48 /DNA_END=523 /DNA_ORIENTATION=+
MSGSISSTSGRQEPVPAIVQRCFMEETQEAVLYFQIMDLGRQLYVWVATGGAKWNNLHLAFPSKTDPVPPVATLVPSAAAADGQSLARRLAIKLKRPVLCSCNLPTGVPLLQAIAERRLVQELTAMASAGPQAAAPATAAAAGGQVAAELTALQAQAL